MEEPGGLQSTGRKESDTTEELHFQYASIGDHLIHHPKNMVLQS